MGTKGVRALSWAQVEEIRTRFETLNPYDRDAAPGSILKLEEENFDETSGQRRQLWCYAISAKRFGLFHLEPDGRPVLRKWSEHGLGHLLNPVHPEDSDRDWIRALWEGIIAEAQGRPWEWPGWLNRPALGRITVSTPSLLRLFDALNRGKAYSEQIKPFNFLLTFFVAPFGHPERADPSRFQLVAPWNLDPTQWLKLICTDRYSGRRFKITTAGATGGDGVVRVKTYANELAEYKVHPELKNLGSDGRPCVRDTVGLLRPRPVAAISITYIGKESNRLDEVEAGIVHDPEEILTEYRDPRLDPWQALVLPVLRDRSGREISEALRLHPTTVKRVRAGRSAPRPEHRAALIALGAEIAGSALTKWGMVRPTDGLACCYAYVKEREHRRPVRNCPVCGSPLSSLRAFYCRPACKQRAYGSRKNRKNACRRTA